MPEREAYYDLTNMQPDARTQRQELAPLYGFLCTYITYDKRASRPGEMVDSSSLRWSVAWQQDNLGAWQFNPHISCAGSAHKPKKHLSHARDKHPDSRRQTQADCTK